MELPADRRERAVERLRDHMATGELTLAEFEERVQTALEAASAADLERATRGLPDAPAPRPERRPARRWVVAVMGGSTLAGRWRWPSASCR